LYLGRAFFAADPVTVARALVGAVLEVTAPGTGRASGRIVEVEAYGGPDDPASHAAGGPTPRSAIMFGPPGLAYVYFIYGMHHCLNVVTGPAGSAGAVLIRALEPLEGRDGMAVRRGLDPLRCRDRDLAGGPGRVCQALGIDLAWNGLPVTARALICAGCGGSPAIGRRGRTAVARGLFLQDRRASCRRGSVALLRSRQCVPLPPAGLTGGSRRTARRHRFATIRQPSGAIS
jgi:DNA-3-methyladenine glycosylase